MLIEAGFDVAIECPAATPMILQLSIHPSRDADQDAPIGWRRFAPRAMSSRCCPHLLLWISQVANMARQRHLKISCGSTHSDVCHPGGMPNISLLREREQIRTISAYIGSLREAR